MSGKTFVTVIQSDNSQFVTSQTFEGGNSSPVSPRERVRLQPLTEAAWAAEHARRRACAPQPSPILDPVAGLVAFQMPDGSIVDTR